MRADARNLLERLGRQDFAYKEFTDRFGDLELWPAFEALLNDKRLFNAANEPAAELPAHTTRAAPAETPRSAPPESLFARYDTARSQPATGDEASQSLDVRGMLQQLNELTENGKL